MAELTGAYLRQNTRQALNLIAEFDVCADHQEQVRFSAVSSAAKPNITRATAMDVSSGGLGLISRLFVPRLCEGVVRVFAAPADNTEVDPADCEVLFEHRAKVRRVVLANATPTYSLGLAFLESGPDLDERIARLTVQADAVHDARRRNQGPTRA